MSKITFDQQVVLVTGAGRGLGTAYARLLAEWRAFVVVHNAGVDRARTGQSVYKEIISGAILLPEGLQIILYQIQGE